jgi:GGDEF domain-containing protein
VTDSQPTPAPPRARALAELAIDPLLERAEELARRWAGELVMRRPLARLDELAGGALAREAPALCAQVLRALQSDVELARLTGASDARAGSALARRLGAICATAEPLALVEAVELLRGVLWEALLWQLREPSARLTADAADRLAHVCASLLGGALSAEEQLAPREAPVRPYEAFAALHEAPAARGGAVIVDERDPADPVLARREHGSRGWQAPEPPVEPLEEIAIRDQRRDEGPVAWIGSIGAQLERFERDGRPFAVLLVELTELERLRRESSAQQLLGLSGRMEREIAAALGAAASLTRERAGRCWLVAPGADRQRAEALAQRLPKAIPAGPSEAGTDAREAPLELAVSVAVCPEDGRLAAALAAHADVGLYAVRSGARFGSPAGERPASAGERPA